MDTLRGNISGHNTSEDEGMDYDRGEDEAVRELPPAAIGQDERRMQVRAYNFWASLLVDRNLPSIEDLDPQDLPDFGPHSVLIDFSSGIEDPAIVFLGEKLAAECGTTNRIERLSDVPTRSLLSRITDHHLQIIANQAPIGFEAEFVNQRGAAIMYRGILLPFSSDNDTIDFIFGVINWKELADQQTTDELLLEIDQALENAPEPARNDAPLTEWADGPANNSGPVELSMPALPDVPEAPEAGETVWPEPELAEIAAGSDPDDEPLELTELAVEDAGDDPADLAGEVFGEDVVHAENDADILDLAAFDLGTSLPTDADAMELADWLASAREHALAALGSEDRSRHALYAAIGRAYDFSLAAASQPEGYAELVADAGLSVQDRAPMTPLVKLVFGASYDKTRLTEFATALSHGHRLGLEVGAMADHLAKAPGGLKGVVANERKLRRGEEGVVAAPRQSPGERLARKLRKLEHRPIGEVASEGSEFALLIARRLPDGTVALLGEVANDAPLFERAARRLLS